MSVKYRKIFRIMLIMSAVWALSGCGLAVRALREAVSALSPSPTATSTPWVIAKPSPQATLSAPTKQSEVRVVTATPDANPDQALLDASEALIIHVYEKASPSVVHITSRVTQMDFFGDLYPAEGTGSGFVLDTQGHIVTNNHVVEGAESVEVTLFDKTVVPAKIVGLDPLNDLAVLQVKVDESKLHPVDMSFSGELKVGQWAIAIGNPFGLDWTLTQGVVSALGRPLQISDNREIWDVVQTDAAINPGNSGGPLLDSRGQLIGVNSAMRQGAQNIGFAIPLSTVRRVVPELIQNGRYRHPWLAFDGYSLTPELSRRLNLPMDSGILIARIAQNGSVARAGLRGGSRQVVLGNSQLIVGGDVLVAIDGTPIDSNATMRKFLETQTQVGQDVELGFYRGDKLMSARATLDERAQ
jgi:S1-C subfamily serine protease